MIAVTERPTGEAATPPYPGLFQALCLLIACIVLLILAVSVAAIYAPGAEQNPWVLASVNVFVLGSLLWFTWENAGGPFVRYFSLEPMDSGLLWPMALLVVGVSLLASETDNLVRYIVGPPPPGFDLSWLYLEAWSRPLATVFLLLIVAPVTEELLFRGLILRGLLSRYGAVTAVLISALLFALFHVNPWQMPGAFLIGGILGWWYVQTGTVTPCLLGHAAYNAIPLIALAIMPPLPGFTETTAGTNFQPLALDMVGAALTVFGAVLLQRTFVKQRRQALPWRLQHRSKRPWDGSGQ